LKLKLKANQKVVGLIQMKKARINVWPGSAFQATDSRLSPIGSPLDNVHHNSSPTTRRPTPVAMASATDPPLVTDHDDLLADFLEAGEDEEDFEDEEEADDQVEEANGLKDEDLRQPEEDVKLEHAADGDIEMGDASITRAAAAGKSFVSGYETAEEAREILEKVDLGRYDDIRSVAGLAKSLKPVLEVCGYQPSSFHPYLS
jgi:hypothetical protein